MLLALSLSKCVSLQFGSNLFYQKLLNETRLRKPAPPPLDKLATPQKNTLCSFHFARAGSLFLARTRQNSPHTPLPPCSCGDGRNFWRRLFYLTFISISGPFGIASESL